MSDLPSAFRAGRPAIEGKAMNEIGAKEITKPENQTLLIFVYLIDGVAKKLEDYLSESKDFIIQDNPEKQQILDIFLPLYSETCFVKESAISIYNVKILDELPMTAQSYILEFMGLNEAIIAGIEKVYNHFVRQSPTLDMVKSAHEFNLLIDDEIKTLNKLSGCILSFVQLRCRTLIGRNSLNDYLIENPVGRGRRVDPDRIHSVAIIERYVKNNSCLPKNIWSSLYDLSNFTTAGDYSKAMRGKVVKEHIKHNRPDLYEEIQKKRNSQQMSSHKKLKK